MPNSPDYIDGIINLRGKVIPIISMRKRFGLPENMADNHTRVIILDIGGDLLGFTVDAVSEVIRIASAEIQPAPPVLAGGAGQEYISGVVNRDDKLLILLDLDGVFSSEEQALLDAF
jgi:purine-binding chemotaxis protein CheW